MILRNTLVSGLAALLLIGSGCATVDQIAQEQSIARVIAPIEGYTYYDKTAELNFKLQLPEDWEKDETIDDGDVVTAFYSPFENESDTYRENIVITALQIPADIEVGLDDFVEQSHTGLRNSVSSLVTIDDGAFIIGGRPGRKYTFTGQLNIGGAKLNIKGEEYYLIHNNIAYHFTYGAAASKFDAFKPEADKIIDSIEIQG